MQAVEKILIKFGIKSGTLAKLLEIDDSTVSRWKDTQEKRGTNGNIPWQYHDKIRALAKDKKIKLKPEDFLNDWN